MPGNPRGQNAIEYMSVYSWAVLLLVLVIVMFYFYARIPGALVPKSCAFVSGITCDDFVVGTTATSGNTTYIAFLLSNGKPYAMERPLLTVSFNASNVSVPCEPSYVAPGGAIVCELAIGTGMKMGDILRVPVYVRTNYCGLSSNISTCYDAPVETYTGGLRAIDTMLVSNSITLQVYPKNSTAPADGSPDPVYARFFFFGSELRNVPINFSVNSTGAKLGAPQVVTGMNGYAEDPLYAASGGKVAITAKYGNASNSTVVNFT